MNNYLIIQLKFSTADSIHQSAIEANTNIIAGNEDIKEVIIFKLQIFIYYLIKNNYFFSGN
jgi:hypothetical protein